MCVDQTKLSRVREGPGPIPATLATVSLSFGQLNTTDPDKV